MEALVPILKLLLLIFSYDILGYKKFSVYCCINKLYQLKKN